jgi:hypothetical protein
LYRDHLFHIWALPSINQLGNILDLVSPKSLYESQDEIIHLMQLGNVPQQFFVDNEFGYLVAEDGTEFFRSKRIHREGVE